MFFVPLPQLYYNQHYCLRYITKGISNTVLPPLFGICFAETVVPIMGEEEPGFPLEWWKMLALPAYFVSLGFAYQLSDQFISRIFKLICTCDQCY